MYACGHTLFWDEELVRWQWAYHRAHGGIALSEEITSSEHSKDHILGIFMHKTHGQVVQERGITPRASVTTAPEEKLGF